jgi:hypothetical protein
MFRSMHVDVSFLMKLIFAVVVNYKKRAASTMDDPSPPAGSPVAVRPPDDLCDMAFSCELMEDPVVAADGFTYNRKEIADWLVKHNVFAP